MDFIKIYTGVEGSTFRSIVSRVNEKKIHNLESAYKENGETFYRRPILVGDRDVELYHKAKESGKLYEGVDEILNEYDIPQKLKDFLKEEVNERWDEDWNSIDRLASIYNNQD